MFDNIGGKIKTLAKVICWIGIILSIILGILIASTSALAPYAGTSGSGSIISGILVAVFGALGSWIGSFLLYGFGELIDNTKKIEENTRK